MLRKGMRGHDEQQSQMFSYLSPEQRVPKDHPTASDSDDGGRSATVAVAAVQPHVCARRAAIDCSGEAVAIAGNADAVFDSQRAAAGRGDRLEHSVPLVRGVESG